MLLGWEKAEQDLCHNGLGLPINVPDPTQFVRVPPSIWSYETCLRQNKQLLPHLSLWCPAQSMALSLGWVRRVAVAGCLLQEAHNSSMEALHNNPQHPTEGQKKLTYTSQSSWRRGNNVPANQWRGALSPHSWAPFLYPAYSTVFLAENHLCIPVCKKLLRGIVPGELWLLWFLVCLGLFWYYKSI